MAKPLEFPFVYDRIASLDPVVKAMFGSHALYVGEKIIVIFRNKADHTDDNGVWVATLPEHIESLREDFPTLRSIKMFGPGPTTWQNLPMNSPSFEEDADRLCDFILRRDPRIGKVPKSRRVGKKKPARKKITKKTPRALKKGARRLKSKR